VIYVTAIIVDPVLLIAMVASAGAGAWFGAGVVARLPRRPIQIGMGIALLIAGSYSSRSTCSCCRAVAPRWT
jgi:uncharacterized membrane protein YfcA